MPKYTLCRTLVNRFRKAKYEGSKQTIFQLLTSGRQVFYHIVQLTSEDTNSYPPAKQLITSCAEVLGQVTLGSILIYSNLVSHSNNANGKDVSNNSVNIASSTGICEWTWRLSGKACVWSDGVGRAGGRAAGSSLHSKCHFYCHLPLSLRLPWPSRLSIPWPHFHAAL